MYAYPPKSGSMLGQRRNPLLVQCRSIVFDAETALGDCTVFSDCCIIMRVTLSIPTPENTIYWPNADVMLGHRLQRWANKIPTKTL